MKVKVCAYLVPALQHDVVEGGGTTLWRCHSVTMLHLHVVIMMMLEMDGNDCHGCNVDQRSAEGHSRVMMMLKMRMVK